MSVHGVVDGHGERSVFILVHESPDGAVAAAGSTRGWEVFELALCHDAILVGAQ